MNRRNFRAVSVRNADFADLYADLDRALLRAVWRWYNKAHRRSESQGRFRATIVNKVKICAKVRNQR